mgnify:CR=1 FL=1
MKLKYLDKKSTSPAQLRQSLSNGYQDYNQPIDPKDPSKFFQFILTVLRDRFEGNPFMLTIRNNFEIEICDQAIFSSCFHTETSIQKALSLTINLNENNSLNKELESWLSGVPFNTNQECIICRTPSKGLLRKAFGKLPNYLIFNNEQTNAELQNSSIFLPNDINMANYSLKLHREMIDGIFIYLVLISRKFLRLHV